MYLRFICFSICMLFILFVQPPEAFSDYLLGASSQTYQILKYDVPFCSFLGVFASMNLRTPYENGFDPDGNLYAVTYSWQTILRYNGTIGAFVNMSSSGVGLDRPHGLICMLPPYPS